MLRRVVDDPEMLGLLRIEARLGSSPDPVAQDGAEHQDGNDAGGSWSAWGPDSAPNWSWTHSSISGTAGALGEGKPYLVGVAC
jgi:hypothetical protein